MTTYISLLRGINVSGQKLMRMDALKKLYETLGFENVVTYVQSGNVIFISEEWDVSLLAQRLSDQIKEVFGFDVSVIVKTVEQLKRIVDANPLINGEKRDIANLYVTFLSEDSDLLNKNAIEDKKQESEQIAFSKEVIYLYCPDGYGRTKLTNNLFESKLNVIATTRSWKTVNALLEIAVQHRNGEIT